MKSIPIFKSGKHVATSGAAIEFTEAHLQASAAAYDPAKHEAPIVVGHPKADLPAYGWVKGLTYADGALDGEPHQVDAQFAEMVRAGRFKKISASFYTPEAAGNPVPGVYYLRHVGFLGAQPPAVKGLKAIAFGDTDEGVVEFGDWSDTQNASLWRALRDWIISKFGLEEADKVIPGYSVDSLQAAAAQPEMVATPSPSYAETEEERQMQLTKERLDQQAKDLKARQDKLDADQIAFTERENKIKAQEAIARRAEIATYVAGLVKAGKVLPAHQGGLIAYMAGPNEAGVIEFGEGEKKQSKAADAWLREFLSALPKAVDFAERGAGGALPQDMTAEQLAKRAVEYLENEKKAGRTISVTQAVTHITSGGEK